MVIFSWTVNLFLHRSRFLTFAPADDGAVEPLLRLSAIIQCVSCYPLEEVLAKDLLRLTGWLTDWLRS